MKKKHVIWHEMTRQPMHDMICSDKTQKTLHHSITSHHHIKATAGLDKIWCLMDETQVQRYIAFLSYMLRHCFLLSLLLKYSIKKKNSQKVIQNGTMTFVMKDMTWQAIAWQDLKAWSDSSTHLSLIGVT